MEPKYCPQCGQPVSTDARFCPKCGCEFQPQRQWQQTPPPKTQTNGNKLRHLISNNTNNSGNSQIRATQLLQTVCVCATLT